MRSSVSLIKGGRRSQLQAFPREGTKVRRLYDLFLSQPLTPIPIQTIGEILGDWSRSMGGWATYREQLAGYGLDIRQWRHGSWWLVATDERDYLGEAASREAA